MKNLYLALIILIILIIIAYIFPILIILLILPIIYFPLEFLTTFLIPLPKKDGNTKPKSEIESERMKNRRKIFYSFIILFFVVAFIFLIIKDLAYAVIAMLGLVTVTLISIIIYLLKNAKEEII